MDLLYLFPSEQHVDVLRYWGIKYPFRFLFCWALSNWTSSRCPCRLSALRGLCYRCMYNILPPTPSPTYWRDIIDINLRLSTCHRSSIIHAPRPQGPSIYPGISLHHFLFSSSPFRTTAFHPLSPEGASPVFFPFKSISGDFGSRFVSLASSRSWNSIDTGNFRDICFERRLQNCNSCFFYKSFMWSIQIAGRPNNVQR